MFLNALMPSGLHNVFQFRISKSSNLNFKFWRKKLQKVAVDIMIGQFHCKAFNYCEMRLIMRAIIIIVIITILFLF